MHTKSATDIKDWDISRGFPEEAQGANLIFLDPPYSNMLDKEYLALHKDSAAGLSIDGFKDFIAKLCVDSFQTLEPGGHLALIIMRQRSKLPKEVPFMDWPYFCQFYMTYAGFEIIEHIVEQWPTSIYQPYDVVHAKRDKKILGICGSLIIGRKSNV